MATLHVVWRMPHSLLCRDDWIGVNGLQSHRSDRDRDRDRQRDRDRERDRDKDRDKDRDRDRKERSKDDKD